MATQNKVEFIETIVDAITGEETVITLSEDEISNRVSEALGQKTETDAKAAARESALAKLAELGLTAEEIAAL
jgi:DNA-binding NarL/FixJ family response regulator